MSITAAATALGLLGRLIFDVVKWAKEDTVAAEHNRELNNGDKRHTHVAQGIAHKIHHYDLRPAFEVLSKDSIRAAKEEAIKHIDHHIKSTVKIKNETGEFVKE
jgi:hypothetical protein